MPVAAAESTCTEPRRRDEREGERKETGGGIIDVRCSDRSRGPISEARE